MIITANSIHHDIVVGKAYQFKLSPKGLSLEDEDFLNLSSLNLIDLQYQEFMVDNRPFLFLSGVEVVNFTSIRKLFWSPSLDVGGLQEMSLPGIQLRGNDHFEFFHHNGENFLLLARQTGELVRFKVTFGPAPVIELLDRDYLGFSDHPANRNLSVHVNKLNEKMDLYAVDQRGKLMYVPGFLHSFNPTTEIIKGKKNTLKETRLGRNTWITSIPEAFGGNSDLVLGNTSGGLVYLKDLSFEDNYPGENDPQINVYPNPTLGSLTIISSAPGEINLYNTLGQKIISDLPIYQNTPLEINTQPLSNGLYFLQFFSSSGKRITKKIILNKR